MRVTESISTFRIRFQRGREKNKTKENKKKPKKNKQSVSENPRRHHRRPLDRFGDVTFFCLFLIKAHISGHIIDRRQPEDNGKRWCHFFLLEKEILMKSHIENKKKKASLPSSALPSWRGAPVPSSVCPEGCAAPCTNRLRPGSDLWNTHTHPPIADPSSIRHHGNQFRHPPPFPVSFAVLESPKKSNRRSISIRFYFLQSSLLQRGFPDGWVTTPVGVV